MVQVPEHSGLKEALLTEVDYRAMALEEVEEDQLLGVD